MKYKVVEGSIKHGEEGQAANIYEVGDEIELSKDQASKFGNKIVECDETNGSEKVGKVRRGRPKKDQ